MYRHILVAIGEQPWSSSAVGYGIALATHIGAKLCFLKVLSLPLLSWAPDTVPCSAMVADSLVTYSETVLSWVAAAAEQADVPYTMVRRWGSIPATMTRIAEEEDCDLIVVGAQRRPGWQHPLRGSVVRKVATQARRPVLVVKQPPPHAYDVACWSRALVVIDGSPGAEVTIEYALTLAQAAHLDVCLLHVKAAWAPREAGHGLLRAQETCTLAAAQAVAAGVRYETQVAAGNGIPAILETAAYRQCDVIILGIHEGPHWQRLWRGHLPRGVTAQASFPVLLVPVLPGVPTSVGG